MVRFPALCLIASLVACGSSAEAPPASPTSVAMVAEDGEGEMSEHCKNHAAPEPTSYARSEHAYALPDLPLLDQRGDVVAAPSLAATERPLVMNFIFATCTTICPVMSATFARTQEALGDDAQRVEFVSLSIDPEHDTPAVLARYAEKYGAPDNWRFLTGDGKHVETVLKALDAWKGSKFSHEPITLLRRPGAETWVRLDGLGSATELASEIRGTLLTADAML